MDRASKINLVKLYPCVKQEEQEKPKGFPVPMVKNDKNVKPSAQEEMTICFHPFQNYCFLKHNFIMFICRIVFWHEKEKTRRALGILRQRPSNGKQLQQQKRRDPSSPSLIHQAMTWPSNYVASPAMSRSPKHLKPMRIVSLKWNAMRGGRSPREAGRNCRTVHCPAGGVISGVSASPGIGRISYTRQTHHDGSNSSSNIASQ